MWGGGHGSARDTGCAKDRGASLHGREQRGERRGSAVFLERLLFVQRHKEKFFTQALNFADLIKKMR